MENRIWKEHIKSFQMWLRPRIFAAIVRRKPCNLTPQSREGEHLADKVQENNGSTSIIWYQKPLYLPYLTLCPFTNVAMPSELFSKNGA